MVWIGGGVRVVLSLEVEAGHVAGDACEVLEAAIGSEDWTVAAVLQHLHPPGGGGGGDGVGVQDHGEPGWEVGDGSVDDVLTLQSSTECWNAGPRHPSSQLNILALTLSVLVRVHQDQRLELHPDLETDSEPWCWCGGAGGDTDLTDVVVERRDHEAAD